jgi:hypothetical protein
MKANFKIPLFFIMLLAAILFSQYGATQDMKMKKDGAKMKMSMDELKSWPMASQMAAKDMMDKYGKPDEMTPTMIIWNSKGPWAKTVVFSKEYPHNFPMPHTDLLQQWVSLKVPTDKLDELAMYDGSVVVERTTGMISARCDKEGANFLALNLAHDIIMGKRTVEEAREMYGKEVMKMKAGQMTEYTKGLMFSANMSAADPDMALDKKPM